MRQKCSLPELTRAWNPLIWISFRPFDAMQQSLLRLTWGMRTASTVVPCAGNPLPTGHNSFCRAAIDFAAKAPAPARSEEACVVGSAPMLGVSVAVIDKRTSPHYHCTPGSGGGSSRALPECKRAGELRSASKPGPHHCRALECDATANGGAGALVALFVGRRAQGEARSV